MTPEQIARIEMMRAEVRAMESTLRAMHFELSLLLDEARGEVIEEPQLQEAA